MGKILAYLMRLEGYWQAEQARREAEVEAEEEKRRAAEQAEKIAERVTRDVRDTGQHLVAETLRVAGQMPKPRTDSGTMRLELAKERREDRRYWERNRVTILVGILGAVGSAIVTIVVSYLIKK